jgi:hypothetical protein
MVVGRFWELELTVVAAQTVKNLEPRVIIEWRAV